MNRFNQASKWITWIEIYRIIVESDRIFFIDKFERSFLFKYLIWIFFYRIFILSFHIDAILEFRLIFFPISWKIYFLKNVKFKIFKAGKHLWI